MYKIRGLKQKQSNSMRACKYPSSVTRDLKFPDCDSASSNKLNGDTNGDSRSLARLCRCICGGNLWAWQHVFQALRFETCTVAASRDKVCFDVGADQVSVFLELLLFCFVVALR